VAHTRTRHIGPQRGGWSLFYLDAKQDCPSGLVKPKTVLERADDCSNIINYNFQKKKSRLLAASSEAAKRLALPPPMYHHRSFHNQLTLLVSSCPRYVRIYNSAKLSARCCSQVKKLVLKMTLQVRDGNCSLELWPECWTWTCRNFEKAE
jgi:hypothetical protein